MTAFRSKLHGALALGLLLAPRAALACPVCTGGQKDEVGWALLRGSLILSILPLAAIGAGAWWLRRRARAIAASTESAAAHASTS